MISLYYEYQRKGVHFGHYSRTPTPEPIYKKSFSNWSTWDSNLGPRCKLLGKRSNKILGIVLFIIIVGIIVLILIAF